MNSDTYMHIMEYTEILTCNQTQNCLPDNDTYLQQ